MSRFVFKKIHFFFYIFYFFGLRKHENNGKPLYVNTKTTQDINVLI